MAELRFTSELTRAHAGDAGYDLRSNESHTLALSGHEYGMDSHVFGTGVHVAIPEGHVGLVVPRSGMAAYNSVTVANAPGIIDSGYRGEIKVCLINHSSSHSYHVEVGDRIAQLVVVPLFTGEAVQVESLDDTDRGDGGFGSSGR